MPTFCRHSRLLQNCPICSREQNVEMAPVISSSAPKISSQEPRAPRPVSGTGRGEKAPRSSGRGIRGPSVKVRKLERGAEDGYASILVQGLRSSAEAERLAYELAWAATRLLALAAEPPGRYAEIAADGDLEERTWLALQLELDPDAEPVSWASGEGAPAYRAWAARAGSQQAALTGESYWTPERRFERVFERLGALGLLERDQRFDLLVVLGRLGLYELEAGKLFVGGENEVTWAAKRALGIGDPLLLERRAADLAAATGVPLAALDLGFHNWNVGAERRTGRGFELELEPDAELLAGAERALGV